MGPSTGLVSLRLPFAWISFTLALTVVALLRASYVGASLILVVKRATQYIVYGRFGFCGGSLFFCD